MHLEARRFTEFVKAALPYFFCEKQVLDVGSGDINGNNRFLFDNCEYNGNDVYNARNVTVVSRTKDLQFSNESFDTIISTECFEHDPDYKESITKIYDMLKPDGLFLFTCASTGRPEHGTRRTSVNDSYGTIAKIEDMQDYYKNLTIYDINEIKLLSSVFSVWKAYYNNVSYDLYFVGIKKGSNQTPTLPVYNDRGVISVGIE